MWDLGSLGSGYEESVFTTPKPKVRATPSRLYMLATARYL